MMHWVYGVERNEIAELEYGTIYTFSKPANAAKVTNVTEPADGMPTTDSKRS